MPTYYFAYGADMDSKELDLQHDRRRRPRLRFARSAVATLPGHRLICDISSKNRRGGIFNVVPDASSNVYGMIYELHPGDTISVAALKEGENADYELSLQPVKTVKKGDQLAALVLHAKPAKKQIKPSGAYLDIVIKAARSHSLPAEWVQFLETLR
jgi:hypothetical protein